MAKVPFTKLNLKSNKESKTLMWNDQEIEVKQYLPVSDKLEMISRIINNSADEMKFYNVGKIEIFTSLEFVFTYTNLSFTEKQKEDICKLYDMLISSGLYHTIMENIPKSEYDWIISTTADTVESIYTYQNSIMGVLDNVTKDYGALDLDAAKIYNELADPNNMALLKGIMTKLG